MKTTVIIILAVLLTWYVATFGLPFSCDVPAPLKPPPESPPITMSPELPNYNLIETDTFNLINEQRDAKELPILIWDKDLAKESQELSEKMLASKNYKHSDLNVYENLYWGISISSNRLAKNIFESWMESKQHKDNILEPSIRQGAVGIASDGMSTFAAFMAK